MTDPGAGLVLGESRGRVLDVLRAAGQPKGVQEIAEQVGLHPNTARFHLDGLVDAGLVERRAEERSEPGRPWMVADTLPEPGRAAETAEQAWGRYLGERPAPSQRVDAAERMRRLSAVLADAGFAPDTVDNSAEDARWPVIPLRHCRSGRWPSSTRTWCVRSIWG